jgi:glyoxylase-like metal-dependent hydrolase (beta-lactamase superfamily II)
MHRFAKRLFVAVLLLASLAATVLYQTVVSLESAPVTDDVFVIHGAGGNVGVLRTDHGAVIVDTMTFVMQGRRIRELAERIGGGPTQVVINTHYHQDHTHGNPGFAPGTKIVSTRRTRDYLLFFDAKYWQGDRSETLPTDTFTDGRELRIGGKTVRLVFAGRGHTGGDGIALFVEDRVIHTGDLFFNKRYPRIDFEAGGSLLEWIATIDRILEL